MTFSPLCKHTVSTKNYSSRSGNQITRLIIHYTAGGTDESNVRLLSRSHEYGRDVSCTYVLRRDGSLVGIVPEEYRPWTSGSFSADAPSVTVETVISPKGQATAAQMETLARLAADLSNRYGWGALNRSNIRGHREFAATDCPGPYLWPRMDQIVTRANQLRTGNKPTPAHAPAADIESLADAVIRGEYGNGQERKRRLGSKYSAVQARVNEKLAGKPAPTPKPAAKPAPLTGNIDALADAVIRGEYGNGEDRKRRLGAQYAAVQKRVNEKLAGKNTAKPAVNVDALADAVIRGEYGNGEERKRRLGTNYAAVQARVNHKLGIR